jgi:hypothetical protein
MQQMLSLDVADTCGWVLQTLNFNVADVEFRCCKHVMPSFVLRRKGRRAPDVECGTQHGSQHDRNMRGGEERLPMLDVAHNLVHNMLATRSQHRSLNVGSTTVRNTGKVVRTDWTSGR